MEIKSAEHQRLEEHHLKKANWKKWGPYLSERGWGTVREDYSENGDPWDYFPHDHARSRAFRWNEDGLMGISDRNQYFCLALALWNGKDQILKERFFGLNGSEGNHGEDVKEYYYYLDNTPTHSYMKMLYKYPQLEFPYQKLIDENKKRGKFDAEYELIDTGIFDENRYFDVFAEYGKVNHDDLIIRFTLINRGPQPAEYHLIPTFWFRNTWSWGYPSGPMGDVPGKPTLTKGQEREKWVEMTISHPTLREKKSSLFFEGKPVLLFTENETDNQTIFSRPNLFPFVKDAFHHYVVHGKHEAVNPAQSGTKAGAYYKGVLGSGASVEICLRLTKVAVEDPFLEFNETFSQRKTEADQFYSIVLNQQLNEDEKNVQRQAMAGMLWNKQLYYYDIDQWLAGDMTGVPPPECRKNGRNHDWESLVNFDVISMPDKWEYPWYASWDLAFHCIPFALIDSDFAKRQLVLMTREWYMHTNGALPAYEWNFSDVNPPVHAWASWRVFKIDARHRGTEDRSFLEGIFHKLLLNFTWWVNRKDAEGNNLFQGGFLGLDNISIFDRSTILPFGGHIFQSDGTAWMGFYCVLMMRIALELSKQDPIYQDCATKFFEHFLRIAYAMTSTIGKGFSLWDEEDGFFYDAIQLGDGERKRLKVRSLVGLLPLFACEILEPEMLETMQVFHRRMDWFISKRPNISCNMASLYQSGAGGRRMVSFLTRNRLERVLKYMLDENEFLSPYGIRSLSKYHEHNPFQIHIGGKDFSINYEPAESQTGLFGGNSNWRGPVWFPINFLIIESLQKYHFYYGDDFTVEFPTGSGHFINLDQVATELSIRLMKLFLHDEHGRRPIYANCEKFQTDPHWKDLLCFHEYFHGDTGKGLGACHQTGWTGLVAKILQQSGAKN